jgi:hypothetical protein
LVCWSKRGSSSSLLSKGKEIISDFPMTAKKFKSKYLDNMNQRVVSRYLTRTTPGLALSSKGLDVISERKNSIRDVNLLDKVEFQEVSTSRRKSTFHQISPKNRTGPDMATAECENNPKFPTNKYERKKSLCRTPIVPGKMPLLPDRSETATPDYGSENFSPKLKSQISRRNLAFSQVICQSAQKKDLVRFSSLPISRSLESEIRLSPIKRERAGPPYHPDSPMVKNGVITSSVDPIKECRSPTSEDFKLKVIYLESPELPMRETKKKSVTSKKCMDTQKSQSAQQFKEFINLDDLKSIKIEESRLILENNLNALFDDACRMDETVFQIPDNSFFKKDATLDLSCDKEFSILEEGISKFIEDKSCMNETLKDLVTMSVKKNTAFLGANDVKNFFLVKKPSCIDEKLRRSRKSLALSPELVQTPTFEPNLYSNDKMTMGKNFVIKKIPSNADGTGQWTPQRYSNHEFSELLKDQEDHRTGNKDANSMSLVSNKEIGAWSHIHGFGSPLAVIEEPTAHKYCQNTENDSKGHSFTLPGSDRLFIESKKKIFKMSIWSKPNRSMMRKKTSEPTETTPTKGPETFTNETNVPLFSTPIQRGRDLVTNADINKSSNPTNCQATGP